MSTEYKSSDKGATLSCSNPVALSEGDGSRVGESSASQTTANLSPPDFIEPAPRSNRDVEMEEMVDVRPGGPASINGDDRGKEKKGGVVGIGKADHGLSPSTNYNLLEATVELSDDGEGVVSRWSRNRLHDSRRNLVLQTLAHTLAAFTGEFVGTFLLTLCIISAVAASVIANALVGLWQVAVICGLGVAISIYLSAHISDAHLNPAVTLAFAIIRFRVFSWKKIAVYITAQMLGGFVAGAVLFGTYYNAIVAFEEERGIERGMNGSELSAMIFGEYFPNPALFSSSSDIVSPIGALFTEAWATGVLVFVIFAFTDPHNTTVGSGKHKVPVPILIGATVMILISLYGPLTQAGLNPARDFGPRVFAALAGWGEVAIPGPKNGFWVYIVGPVCGGLAGGALYDLVVAKAMHFKMRMKKYSSGHSCRP